MPTTQKKYHVNRVVHVLQSTVVQAASEADAIEKSRKLDWKSWHSIDKKRRKGYEAKKVEYSS